MAVSIAIVPLVSKFTKDVPVGATSAAFNINKEA
jgi:hypothetical protein